MEDRLEREEQVGPPSNGRPASSVAAPFIEAAEDDLPLSLDTSTLTPVNQILLRRCMDGTEPYGEELKPHQMKKFSPLHINIAILRAAGFRGTEIAQITGAAKPVVYTVLSHPYARKIRAALVPANGARVIDIRTRLEEYAGELLDQTFYLALESPDLEQVGKITFGLLDRAGFGGKPVAPAGAAGEGTVAIVPESVMSRLLSALEGSAEVTAEVMPTWTPRRPPEEALMGPVSPDVGGSSQPAPGEGDASRGINSQVPRVAAGGGR